jgi:hypothetical protein
VRRFQVVRAQTTEIVTALVIGQKDNEVGLPLSCGQRGLEGGSTRSIEEITARQHRSNSIAPISMFPIDNRKIVLII